MARNCKSAWRGSAKWETNTTNGEISFYSLLQDFGDRTESSICFSKLTQLFARRHNWKTAVLRELQFPPTECMEAQAYQSTLCLKYLYFVKLFVFGNITKLWNGDEVLMNFQTLILPHTVETLLVALTRFIFLGNPLPVNSHLQDFPVIERLFSVFLMGQACGFLLKSTF